MLSLEVTINGRENVVAGDAMAQTLNATVTVHPGFNRAWIEVDGQIVPDGQPAADAHWLSSSAALGDVVQIRLIESDAPTVARMGRIDLEDAATDAIPFVCSFCGKSRKEVEGMIVSRRAMICRGCLRELNAIAEDDEAASAD